MGWGIAGNRNSRLQQNYCARYHFVARGSKILIYCRVNSGFTPGILPSALRGQLKLFKITPGDFVLPLAPRATFARNVLLQLAVK